MSCSLELISYDIVFFSHNKSANSILQPGFSAKRASSRFLGSEGTDVPKLHSSPDSQLVAGLILDNNHQLPPICTEEGLWELYLRTLHDAVFSNGKLCTVLFPVTNC